MSRRIPIKEAGWVLLSLPGRGGLKHAFPWHSNNPDRPSREAALAEARAAQARQPLPGEIIERPPPTQ